METKSPFQQSAQPVYPGSAPLRLFKVEAGINGLLPTSWAPPIYSVSLLSKLCFALGGNGLLRQAAARSFLAHSCKRKNRPNQQKKPVRGLDNVGFIAASRLTRPFWTTGEPLIFPGAHFLEMSKLPGPSGPWSLDIFLCEFQAPDGRTENSPGLQPWERHAQRKSP
jgi:hypothetical protein